MSTDTELQNNILFLKTYINTNKQNEAIHGWIVKEKPEDYE